MENKSHDAAVFAKMVTAEIALLILQFILGMIANLYGNVSSAAFWSSPAAWIVIAHIIVALAILGIGIRLLIYSRRFGSTHVSNSMTIGLAGVLISFASGMIFLFGGANDIFSLSMAIGFIIAFSAYGFALGRYAIRPMAPM